MTIRTPSGWWPGHAPSTMGLLLVLTAPLGFGAAVPQVRARAAARPRTPPAARPSRGPRHFVMIPPPGMKMVKRPTHTACALETDRFHTPDGFQIVFPLLAAPGTRPFATVEAGALRVLVPAGHVRSPYVVEAEAGGLFLRGYLGPNPHPQRGAGPGTLIVHPTRAQAIGGFYWPTKKALLRLTRHPTHGFAVAPMDALPNELKITPGTLPAPVPCDSISLDPATHDLVPRLPPGKPRIIGLAPGASLPLYDRPGGRHLATLSLPKNDDLNIGAYPPDRGYVLLVWKLEYATVAAFVDARRLAAVKRPPYPDARGFGGMRLGYGRGTRGGGRSPDPRLVCEDDVLMAVSLDPPKGSRRPTVRVIVGGFRAGTRIPIAGSDGLGTTVYTHLLPGTVSPVEKIRFYLPRVLLGACKPD